ncbi:DNA repair protein RecO [Anaerotignum neopropionicum]|uniref:DNA repair protein RecO n=1 Tax=Anaerotignum neopropionicum TaxID=36847 RepID=A0A136WJC0_9FIRM|nr:DNA repair protein RecO [Anaerotignum neopropionicum]KXL54490.1 DNA repair protein RecO [Anaerotignum neopropionicum]
MSVVKLRGIVIGESQNGESSKRILVLAKDVGRVMLNARGAKNTKSKLLSGTQLFSYCDFMAYTGKGFYSLTQADLIESFYDIRMDMDKLAEAVYLAELVEKTCPAGMEQDETLRLLLYTLTALEKTQVPPRLISRIFEVKYLQLSGLLSDEGCMVCGKAEEPLFFNEADGEFLCRKHCRGGEVPMLGAVQKAISFVTQRGEKQIFAFVLSQEAMVQMDEILRRYLEVHMGVRLKSREFSKEL